MEPKEPANDEDENGCDKKSRFERRRRKVLDFWTEGRLRKAKPRRMASVAGEDHHAIAMAGGDGAQDLAEATVADERWSSGGAVLSAAGRLLFVMGNYEYVCSATAISDMTRGSKFRPRDASFGGRMSMKRSLIITAAHCVYDDVANEVSVHSQRTILFMYPTSF